MENIFSSVPALVTGATLSKPFFAFRPEALSLAASFFVERFNANCLFAVKTNPDPLILNSLYRHGITSFDVASLTEVEHLRALLPDAELYFMHPVKPRRAIREAYHTHGVRHFSMDTQDELQKILEETGHAKDLTLHLRLSMPNAYSEMSLAEKFGVNLQDAPALLQQMRSVAAHIGVCFHVGSQCMHPDAYRISMRMASAVIIQSGVQVDYFNVGGGFPSTYPGMTPPPMQHFFDAIHAEFERITGHEKMTLLAEPGRALVAESCSLVVQVESRKGTMLYINDGTYGGLFDAGSPKFIYPVRLLRDESTMSSLVPFSFYGPTCDSLDFMKGPFYLPNDVREGDYIEIGQMGAYGRTMATRFNGFSHDDTLYIVNDDPLMSMYGPDLQSQRSLDAPQVAAA